MENNITIIGFWKIGDKYGCFSNWYKAPFTLDGNTFQNSEQAFMYKKALLFNDKESATKILNTANPMIVKSLGRGVKPFDSEIFNQNKEQLMYECVYAKFSQNKDLKDKLIATQEAILCEASPKDKIWGIGLAENNPDFNDMSKWVGQNLLGNILMKIRKEFKEG